MDAASRWASDGAHKRRTIPRSGTLACLTLLCVMLSACHSPPETGKAGSQASEIKAGAPKQASAPTGVAPPAAAEQTGSADDATYLRLITGEATQAHAMLDGAPVTAINPAGHCTGAFVTQSGTTAVRWGLLGDMAPTDDKKLLSIPILIEGQAHHLTLASGDGGDRVMGALALMEMECQGIS